MTFLKIPKSLLWLLTIMATLLVVMSLYRYVSVHFFTKGFSDVPRFRIMMKGIGNDFGYLAIVTLPLLLIGLLPGLHLFKSHTGKVLTVAIYTVFTAFMLVLYGLDCAHQISFMTRLNSAIFTDIASSTPRAATFKHNAPWLAIGLLAATGTWLMYMWTNALHRWLGFAKVHDVKAMRLFWQILLVVLLGMAVFSTLLRPPLSVPREELKTMEQVMATHVVNPFESLRP